MTRKENGFRLTCGGQDDAELPLRSHFHLGTSIGLNSENARMVIPAKMCPGRNIFLVGERHSIVVVQSERAVRAGKSIERRRPLHFFGSVLANGIERDDRTSAEVKW